MLHGVYKALAATSQPVIWVVTEQDQKLLQDAGLPKPAHHHWSTFVPQNDVLGHQSVTIFITQGGTNSIYEALFHGVRPIVIPLFFEQVTWPPSLKGYQKAVPSTGMADASCLRFPKSTYQDASMV